MSRRIPWLAALMSLVLPGFGQLYNGQVNRAIWVFLTFAGFLLPGAILAVYLPSSLMLPVFLIGHAIGFITWIFAIVDAYVQARRQREYVPKVWQSTGVYALILVMFCFVVLPLVINYVRQHQVQSFFIPTNSMNPTLQKGDFIFTDMRYNCPNCSNSVQRGDVVIFVYPNDRTKYFVKRIIGLPGDTVDIKNGHVSINSERLLLKPFQDQTIEQSADKRWSITDTAIAGENLTVEVGNGEVFVLGDNRGFSNDSRKFGTVPLVDVVGKVRQIWYSKNDEGSQWSRVGTVLQ